MHNFPVSRLSPQFEFQMAKVPLALLLLQVLPDTVVICHFKSNVGRMSVMKVRFLPFALKCLHDLSR